MKITDKRYGAALNVDGDIPTYMYYQYVGEKVDTEKDAHFTDNFLEKIEKWYDDRYANCGLSDILFSISMHDKTLKYQRTEEQLEPDDESTKVAVDYSAGTNFRSSYLAETATDVSLYGELFRLCRKDGINPWLSFRMNDVHYANEPTGHGEIYYWAKKNGWLVGDARSDYWRNNDSTRGSRLWYPNALNYASPEVRRHFLNIIDKQLDMYDPYGIELDWQRSIWCFPTDTLDNVKYMDMMLADVNEIVAKYEKKYGHEIKISARINRDIDENMYLGFDVRNWAKNGWIDVVIPSCYWGATDTEIPVAKWKSELADYPDVEVWPGVECHMMNNLYWQSKSTLAAQTAQYLCQGADKMYLFNLFNDVKEKFEVCASLENALAADRSYVVTRANSTPLAEGIEEYHPLPVVLTSGERSREVVISHGTLRDDKAAVLYVGIEGEGLGEITEETLGVYYNGEKCEFVGVTENAYIGANTAFGVIVGYKIPCDAVKDSNCANVEFLANYGLSVRYLELSN